MAENTNKEERKFHAFTPASHSPGDGYGSARTRRAAGDARHRDKRVSPEIQNLLNMVQVENRKYHSLSERLAPHIIQDHVSDVSAHSLDQNQICSGDGTTRVDHQEQSLSHPPTAWEQEKKALLETVMAQTDLLSQMEQKHRQAVQVSVEQHRSEVMALQGQLEQERVACSNLRRDLQVEQSQRTVLEQHLAKAHNDLEDERQRLAIRTTLNVQGKERLERLLIEAQQYVAENQYKYDAAHRKLDDERDSFFRQLDDLKCRYEADTARDSEFIADMRVQLEQERRQREELAAVADKMKADVRLTRRRWEEDVKRRWDEVQLELEAASQVRVAMVALKEQAKENRHALEVERERSKHKDAELLKLQETIGLLKDRELEREEPCCRKSRKKTEKKDQQEKTKSDLMQHLYECYLRAETRRKVLAYEKRYLQHEVEKYRVCEDKVPHLLSEMGSLSSSGCPPKLSPLGRFRAAVGVVIAVSRMRFLNRKWQMAVNRFSKAETVHEQAPGSSDPNMSGFWSNAKYFVFVQPK